MIWQIVREVRIRHSFASQHLQELLSIYEVGTARRRVLLFTQQLRLSKNLLLLLMSALFVLQNGRCFQSLIARVFVNWITIRSNPIILFLVLVVPSFVLEFPVLYYWCGIVCEICEVISASIIKRRPKILVLNKFGHLRLDPHLLPLFHAVGF